MRPESPGFLRAIPASCMAGCTGLEPVASGVTVHVSRRATPRQRSQLLGTTRKQAAAAGPASVPFAHFRRRLGTPLVRTDRIERGKIIPLTVRQVAIALRENRAIIYNGVAKGRYRACALAMRCASRFVPRDMGYDGVSSRTATSPGSTASPARCPRRPMPDAARAGRRRSACACRRALRRSRQREPEGAAAAGLALDAHLAAVRLHDLA